MISSMLPPPYCIVPLPRRTCKQPVPPHRGTSIRLRPPYTVTQVGGLRPLNEAHFFLRAALSWAICRDSPGVLGTYWRGQDPGCHSPGPPLPWAAGWHCCLQVASLQMFCARGQQELGSDRSQGPCLRIFLGTLSSLGVLSEHQARIIHRDI